jgi:hypothetical protein
MTWEAYRHWESLMVEYKGDPHSSLSDYPRTTTLYGVRYVTPRGDAGPNVYDPPPAFAR